MKYILLLMLIIINLIAKEVDVDIQADYFEANKQKNIVLFKGKVSMIKGTDTLTSDKLEVYTRLNKDTNKTMAYQYIATGKVRFTVTKPTTLLIGKGDKVVYKVDDNVYTITGNGYLEDKNASKIVMGDKIYINNNTGETKIEGKANAPVKFKFKMLAK